jgi:cytidylate kinase
VTERDRRDSQVVDFMSAADGVTTLDSTQLNFGETVAAVVDLITGRIGETRVGPGA